MIAIAIALLAINPAHVRYSMQACLTGPGGAPACWAIATEPVPVGATVAADGTPAIVWGRRQTTRAVGLPGWDMDRDGDIDLRDWAIHEASLYRVCGCLRPDSPYVFYRGEFVSVRECVGGGP